jgi:hypothetical protein
MRIVSAAGIPQCASSAKAEALKSLQHDAVSHQRKRDEA